MPPVSLIPLQLLAMTSGWTVHTLPFTLHSGETARKHLPATMGGGIAVFDYDGDGKLDLFFANGGELPQGKKRPNALLRNLGTMRFENVTSSAGLEGSDYSFGAAVSSEGLAVTGLRTLTLYRAESSGRYRAIALDNKGRWSVGAAWFDMDGDQDLDLFVVNYVHWDPAAEHECQVAGRPDFCHPRYYDPQPNALFRNDGGKFIDVSESSGIAAHKGKGMAVAVADFDGDSKLDLFVTNDRMPAFFFRNLGNGRFKECAFDVGIAVPTDGKPVSGMGIDVQDYDNDGKPDIIYTALRDETFPLYRNTGRADGFEEWTVQSNLSRLSRQMAGWGVAFVDLDSDGLRDIAVARSDALSGKVSAARKEPLSWFRNLGDGKFAAESLPVEPRMYRGLVAADFNGDGCADLVATALDAPAIILRNPCQQRGKPASRQWLGSTTVGYASSYMEPKR